MRFEARILIIVLAFLPVIGTAAQGILSPSPQIRHVPPDHFLKTEPLLLSVETGSRLEWLVVFWKTPEAEDYESLNFETRDGRTYEARLETSGLAGKEISYYLAYKSEDRIFYRPENAPPAAFTVTDATPAGAAVAPPSPPAPAADSAGRPFPLRIDGSAETTVVKSGDDNPTSAFSQSHSVRLEYGYRSGGLALDLGARLSYMDKPIAGENALDLPDLNFSAAAGRHTFRAGDLSFSESEFTIASYGRRGVEYSLRGETLTFHVFTAATQQVRGFKGVGLPKAGASLVGGAAGLTLFKSFTLKAVFVTGEDDPTFGINVGTSSLFHRRKGQVLAVVGESRLLGESLNVQAEFASSRYDANLDDGENMVSDSAWRLRGTYRQGAFDAQAGYRSIGKDFNTVGQPFFLNDRRGFDAAAGLSLGKLRFGGSYRVDETNVDADAALATAKMSQGRADASLQFGVSSSVRFGFLKERQEASFSSGLWNPYSAFEGTLDKTGLSAGLDIGLASWLRVSVSGEKADLICPLTPSMEGAQTSAMAGFQIMIPDFLTLFPVISYSRIAPAAGGEETRSLLASLSGELTIIRRWLTWNVIGAFGDSKQGGTGTTRLLSADSGLNLNLRPLLGIGDVLISLRGQYFRTQMTGQTTQGSRAAVRLAYSF